MPDYRKHPVIISQDGTNSAVEDVVKSFPQVFAHFQRLKRKPIDPPLPKKEKPLEPYYYIASHYEWALKRVFTLDFDKVIILEEDLEISPDFFEYFTATYPLLLRDSSLYAISAYNDNNKELTIDSSLSSTLHRSDFFPGLGWLLTRSLYNELAPSWPVAFWDDWMREPERRKDRQSIVPALSRSHTFGKKGASKGQFFDKNLKTNFLSKVHVPFAQMDLSRQFLDNEAAYSEEFFSLLARSKPITASVLLSVKEGFNWIDLSSIDPAIDPMLLEERRKARDSELTVYRVRTTDVKDFEKTTKALGLMTDLKAEIPRTGYKDHVKFYWRKNIVLLASPKGSLE